MSTRLARLSPARRAGLLAAACLSVLALAALGTPTALARSTRGTSSGSSSPCGASIAKPGGGTWTCTFADDFNGNSLDTTKWTPVLTSWSGTNFGGACLTNQGVKVSGGYLNLTVAKTAPFSCASLSSKFTTSYYGGEVTTLNKWGQTDGRWDIRAKFPRSTRAGLQASLWMLPYDLGHYGAWPISGEIDLAEMYSFWPSAPIPYIHYDAAATDPNVTTSYCVDGSPSSFHTYSLVWTPTTITISYDNKTCLTDSWNPAAPLVKPQPFDVPFVLTLTQGLGVGTNAVTSKTQLPATTQIDYVHVWS